MQQPVRPPDQNTNITVRVLLFLLGWLVLSNTFFQWFGKPYADPWWAVTFLTAATGAVVYATYEKRRRDAKEEQQRITLQRPQKILLIEDSAFAAECVRRMLLNQDTYFDIAVAHNAEVALKMLRREGDYIHYQLPDQILLDLNFGDGRMTGQEFISIVKNDPALAWIPINIFSGTRQVDAGDVAMARNAGWFAAWIEKGTGPYALLDAIKKASDLSFLAKPKGIDRAKSGEYDIILTEAKELEYDDDHAD